MNSKMKYSIILLFIIFVNLDGQVTLTRNYFYDLQAYHLQDFNLENASQNPNFFSYTLSYHSLDNVPANLIIEMQMTATLPAFGLQNTTLFSVRSKVFPFLGTVNINSLDLDNNLETIAYENSDEKVDFHGSESEEFISEADFNIIRNNVLATGDLPIGQYVFHIKVFKEHELVESDQKIITISSPNNLELIEPGGELSDIPEINTTYPIFRWDSESITYDEKYCNNCGIYIRVSEYEMGKHSSLQNAIYDKASLPFPDNGGFKKIVSIPIDGNLDLYKTINNFIYPQNGVRNLEKGKYYVWQVKKIFPSTSGSEEIVSEIFIFKIRAVEEQSVVVKDEDTEEINKFISQITNDQELLDSFFEEIKGFKFSGEILLGNKTIEMDELKNILGKISTEDYKLQSIIIK